MLEPFRIANAYGLFAVMTEARYEIEFQGSRDGVTWVPYPFRYKPQDPRERPGIYAPYQPRFEWNLWFASLGPWQQSSWVVLAQQRLIEGSPAVATALPARSVCRAGRRRWCEPCSGSTGSPISRPSGGPERGGRRNEIGPFTGVVGQP